MDVSEHNAFTEPYNVTDQVAYGLILVNNYTQYHKEREKLEATISHWFIWPSRHSKVVEIYLFILPQGLCLKGIMY